MRGKEQETLNEVAAGDIAAVAKLTDTGTGDVLTPKGAEVDVRAARHCRNRSSPSRSTRSRRATRTSSRTRCTGSRTKTRCCVSSAIPRRTRHSVRGMGETHVSITMEKLATQVRRHVETEDVRVPYRETITGTAEAEGQDQEADRRPRPVRRRVAAGRTARSRRRPRVRRRDRRRRDPSAVHPGGAEGGRWRPSSTAACSGIPIVDVKVTVFDGKHHPVDSSEMAFKTAASDGMKEATGRRPVPLLLEPISELVVTVPEASQGDVMGDMNSKRGRIQGTAAIGDGEVEVIATSPTIGDHALLDRPALDDRRSRPVHGAPTRTTTPCPRTSSTRSSKRRRPPRTARADAPGADRRVADNSRKAPGER